MDTVTHEHVYEELARRCEEQHEARRRDIFLVLAADAAFAAGRADDAERLRMRLLQLSPHSLLCPYASFADALQARDIQDYIADLRRLHPPEQAEQLLRDASGKKAKEGDTAPPVPIYRFQDAPPRPAPPPATPRRQAPAASPYAKLDAPLPSSPADDASGGWLALFLFFVVFLAGVGLAGYVLMRPFL
jgi:hypothetical protein